MDEDRKQGIAGSTQHLLADRLRQRYARCRETLASYTREAEATPASTRPPRHLVVVTTIPQPRVIDTSERFATLFSQAYNAARGKRDNTPVSLPRRHRQ